MPDDSKCKCGAEGRDEHTCPFKSEINDDEETKCNCCEACTHDCLWDV